MDWIAVVVHHFIDNKYYHKVFTSLVVIVLMIIAVTLYGMQSKLQFGVRAYVEGDKDKGNDTMLLEIICVAPVITDWTLTAGNLLLDIPYTQANDTQREVSHGPQRYLPDGVTPDPTVAPALVLWYNLTVNITTYAGWGNIRYINITAWFDEGEDDFYKDITNAGDYGLIEWEYNYHNSTYPGGNRNFKIVMEQSPTGDRFKLLWPLPGYNGKPPEEQEVVLGYCSNITRADSVDEEYGPRNKTVFFNWSLRQQIHWAPGDGIWEGPTGNLSFPEYVFNDLFSWNFNISVEDRSNERPEYVDVVTGKPAPINRAWSLGEFGTYKYTSVNIHPKQASKKSAHGVWTETSTFNVTVSANSAYNLTVDLNHSLNFNLQNPYQEIQWSDINISSKYVEFRLCPIGPFSEHRYEVATSWGDNPFYNITGEYAVGSSWQLANMTTDNSTKINPWDEGVRTVYGGKGFGGGWIMRLTRAEDGCPRDGTFQKIKYAVFRVYVPYGTPGGIYISTVKFIAEIDSNPIKGNP